MSELEGVIRRVQKLLAVARGNANANESATAAAMAEKIMRKYQLAQADVLVKNLNVGSVEVAKVNHGRVRWGKNEWAKSVPDWVGALAVGCAVLNDCHADSYGGVLNFYGVEGDQTVASEMFVYLLKEIDRLTLAYHGMGNSKRVCKDFRLGCADMINARLQELHKERMAEFEETSSGRELMVVKGQLIEESLGRKFEYRQREDTPRSYAYSLGVKAGSKVSLEKQLKGG